MIGNEATQFGSGVPNRKVSFNHSSLIRWLAHKELLRRDTEANHPLKCTTQLSSDQAFTRAKLMTIHITGVSLLAMRSVRSMCRITAAFSALYCLPKNTTTITMNFRPSRLLLKIFMASLTLVKLETECLGSDRVRQVDTQLVLLVEICKNLATSTRKSKRSWKNSSRRSPRSSRTVWWTRLSSFLEWAYLIQRLRWQANTDRKGRLQIWFQKKI